MVANRKEGHSPAVEDKLLTPNQAAERLQVTERTVYTWLRQERLRGYKVGRLWRIGPKDLEQFLETARPEQRRSARRLGN